MTLYIVFLVITIVGWIVSTALLTMEAFDFPRDAARAKRARLAWLSFFLIPVYPAVVIVLLVAGPIKIFRHLGRLNEDKEK